MGAGGLGVHEAKCERALLVTYTQLHAQNNPSLGVLNPLNPEISPFLVPLEKVPSLGRVIEYCPQDVPPSKQGWRLELGNVDLGNPLTRTGTCGNSYQFGDRSDG